VTNYINNKRFEELIALHCSGISEHDSELMENFNSLIDNIISAFHFNVDKEDAKQECFVLILKTLNNFNSNSGSAFNYFTTVILNNLKLVTTKAKRHRQKLEDYFEYKFGICLNPYDPSS
jgi:DNA-directed RNA polymerase specialized sigma subunit